MRDWAEGYGCRNVVVRGCEFSDAKINSGLYGVYHEIFAAAAGLTAPAASTKRLRLPTS